MDKIKTKLAARTFFNSGRMDYISESDLAAECEKTIQEKARTSLKDARKMADKYALRSEIHGKSLRLSSQRLLARISHMTGDHQAALNAYLAARKLSGKDRLLRARIDRALVDVYMYLAQNTEAKRAANRSIKVFTDLKMDSDLAQTRVNYANLLHRQDRHKEAEILYRQAGIFFEKQNNQLAVARCDYNRANTLVQLFELDKAEKLYEKSRSIYKANEFALDACDADYSLAWLHMLKGNFHQALLGLQVCEKVYRDGGDPRGETLCHLDRAEVFLGLGMYRDALEVARLAETKFGKLGLRYEKAKAALFRGQAAMTLGLKKEAQTSMLRAQEDFEAEKNKGFLGVVHLLKADLVDANQDQRNVEINAAQKLFRYAQLPLWEALSEMYKAAYQPQDLAALKRLEKNAAVRHVPHLYTMWQTLYGDYYYRRGKLQSARRRWQKAADRLDTVRAQLPPLEFQNAFGRKLSSPHLRLIASEINHDTELAAVWSERYKTAGIWAPIASLEQSDKNRQEIEEGLAALARQVATLTRKISPSTKIRSYFATSYGQAFVKLQKQIRNKLLEIEKLQGGNVASVERIAEKFKNVSEDLPVVQFHIQDDDIYAFVHQNGSLKHHCFYGGRKRLDYTMQRWRFILESEILSGYLGTDGNKELEESLWSELGEWLWVPLEVKDNNERVLILPEGELANLPWPALIVNDKPLLERHLFVTSPSLRHYLNAKKNKTGSEKIFVFRGKSDNLPEANKEIDMLIRRSDKKTSVFNPCHRSNWPDSGKARLWHFVGHAEICPDNPFYSNLILDDGPIFAADFRLKKCQVGLVTLSACRSGEHITIPGEELTGLTRSLLEMGARNVIASHWPVSDETTAIWMQTFYDKYFKGIGILDSARMASMTVRKKYPSAYYWAAFSILGAGDIGEYYEKNKKKKR